MTTTFQTMSRKDQTSPKSNKMGKRLEIKGLLGLIAAVLAIAAYIIYYLYLEVYGIKLNKIFFVSTGISISTFSGLLFTFFRNKVAKAFTLFCSIFYFILVLSYVSFGLIMNQYFAHIKLSLITGLIAGIIFLVYDTFANSSKH